MPIMSFSDIHTFLRGVGLICTSCAPNSGRYVGGQRVSVPPCQHTRQLLALTGDPDKSQGIVVLDGAKGTACTWSHATA
ncbi:MAG: hypothetical protein ACE5I7_09475 [Candidatus Binatia bacterium]